MKKIGIATLLIASTLPLSSHAQLIIGAGINKSSSADLKLENEKNGITKTYDLDTNTASFYIGYKNHKNNRFLISLDNLDAKVSDLGYSSKATGVRLDAQFVYGQSQIKPYWGLGFGVYTLKESPLVSDETHSGVSLQVMGGTKIDLTKNLELDLNLEIQGMAWQDVEYRSRWITETISMTSSKVSVGAGLAYKF